MLPEKRVETLCQAKLTISGALSILLKVLCITNKSEIICSEIIKANCKNYLYN